MGKGSLLFIVFAFASGSIAQAAEMTNGLTTVTTNEAKTLLEGPGLSIDLSSVELIGNVRQFTSITSLNTGIDIDSANNYGLSQPGLLLTSSTTTGAVSAGTQTAIESFMEGVLTGAGYTGSSKDVKNLSAIKFQLTSSLESMALDFLFASYEYHFQDWDIAVVSVNGVNYAKLPGNQILRVTPAANLIDFRSGPDINSVAGISVWAAAPTQSLVAPLNSGTNTILIAVGDTGDNVVSTVLMISGLSGSSSTEIGIVSFGADESSPVLPESQGSAFRFDSRPTLLFSEGNIANSYTCKLGQISYSEEVGQTKFRQFVGTVNPQDSSKTLVTYEFWLGEESLYRITTTDAEATYVFVDSKKPTRCSTSVSSGLDTYTSWSN